MAAKRSGVWGIDIGQAGLKAIRLEYNLSSEQVVATAYDYIAHPKILSQPDAIPEELIPLALEKFLKQNDIKSDSVAISVPGQSALARFIQLPPVESSRVSEIIKYEAKQQIPFDLQDVVWDYQTLGKGTEESGFLLEAEVGLFAMKRDQLMNHLKPFANAGVEVDLIQISPLALYNFLSYDHLGVRLGDETIAMDTYTILLDMGADNTILLVSNGQKIWIRNVNIGGNHFTRALTKEMKLTFAKAEHLKCNATKSPDPRAVFQALRPVFNDYVSEIQRSIGFFSSVNREAKISKVIGLGNGFKLAGLQKFLQQNLQYEVERVDKFNAITPESFRDAALFEENLLSFPVCYGAALQGLKQTRIRTSLLPKEITTARTIVRKKPWAVAAAAGLMAALSMSVAGHANVYRSVAEEKWKESFDAATSAKTEIGKLEADYTSKKTENGAVRSDGDRLVQGVNDREKWFKLYKAVNEALPRDEAGKEPEDIRLQNRIKIASIQATYRPDLAAWYERIDPYHKDNVNPVDKAAPPTAGGWVVSLRGEHYHDELLGKDRAEGGQDVSIEIKGRSDGYVREAFVKNLEKMTLPAHDKSGEVPIRAIGITHPVLTWVFPSEESFDPTGRTQPVQSNQLRRRGGNRGKYEDDNESGFGDRLRALRERQEQDGAAGKGEDGKSSQVKVDKTDFIVEFVWTPEKPPAPIPAGAAPNAPQAPQVQPAGAAPPVQPAASPAPRPTS